MHRCKRKQQKILQNKTCWPPSPNQFGHPRPNSTSCTLFILFVQQTCQNTARMIAIPSISLFIECMDGLFHKISEWCIKYGAITTTENFSSLSNNA